MDNNQNPFFSIREHKASYNSIKRNRAFRSEKKFTQGTQHLQPHRETLKTELIALIQSAPKNDTIVIQNCIDELKQKLLQINFSSKRRPTKPLQQYSILKRKTSETNNGRIRAKTNNQQKSERTGSKSVHLVRESRSVGKHKLANLQDLRNQIKRNKLLYSEKRLSTQKVYRYDNFQQIYQTQERQDQRKKKQKNRSSPKFRSMTEQVVRSYNNPARIYHNQSQKKSKTYINQLQGHHTTKTNQLIIPLGQLIDNNSKTKDSPIKQKKEYSNNKKMSPAPIDNNQKIADISTIMAQKQTLNFLGDSCVGIKQELSPKKRDPDSSKILDFIGWKTAELKNIFLNSKQQKRKQGLDRLSKVFPKDFFN